MTEILQSRIEQLERYIVQLEEKICHLEISRDNLITNRDEVLTRSKEKGERAAEVIKKYRTALQCGLDYVSSMKYNAFSLPQILDSLLDKFETAAKDAMNFKREPGKEQGSSNSEGN